MMNKIALNSVAVTLFLLLVSVAPEQAHADPALDRMRDQLRQTIIQLRQLEDENLSLKAKQTAVVAPVVKVVTKDNSAELAQLRSAARAEGERTTTVQKQLDAANAQLQQLQTALTQANSELRQLQTATTSTAGQLQLASSQQKSCTEHNQQLVTLTKELLGRYQHKGFWQSVREREPVTALYRVRLENIIQGYSGQIADATVLSTPPDTHAVNK